MAGVGGGGGGSHGQGEEVCRPGSDSFRWDVALLSVTTLCTEKYALGSQLVNSCCNWGLNFVVCCAGVRLAQRTDDASYVYTSVCVYMSVFLTMLLFIRWVDAGLSLASAWCFLSVLRKICLDFDPCVGWAVLGHCFALF